MPCVFFVALKNWMDMKNDYDEFTPEELELQDNAEYYIQLYGYIMGERPSLLELHDELCNLLAKIADEFPESIAPNRGNVMAFPKVKVLVPDAPNYGKRVSLRFDVVAKMFENKVDYEASIGLKGDVVFFLSLALWYEVCRVRDKLRLKGIAFIDHDKAIAAKRDEALMRKRQEALLKESREGARDLPVHFAMAAPQKTTLRRVLEGLKSEGWLDEHTRVEDWVYRLTGQLPPNGYPSQEPITFSSINQCRFVVKNFIFKDSDVPKEAWRKVTQVFPAKKGDIMRVQRANKIPSGSNRVEFLWDNDGIKSG